MSIKVFNSPESRITVGQGEYIVYHQDQRGVKTALDRKTFDAVYPILNHLNSPLIDHRYDVIRSNIKSLDPSLEITFIPRTYYELHFLKKCIKEDLKKGDFCQNEQNRPNPYLPGNTKDCWHLVHFDHEEDNQAEGVKVLAFNMNNNLVKKINKQLNGESLFSFQKISVMCDKQIQFFSDFGRDFNLALKRRQGQFGSNYFSEGTPIHKFSGSSTHNMSITTPADAAIIRNAVTLECHSIAEKSFLLARGTDFPTDLPYSPDNVSEPYSFSFGSGLFAGALYRGGATAFVYMKDAKDGYMMAVPAQELHSSPFVIPKKHTLCHLSSHYGTVFHPRTKIWHTNGSIWGGLDHDASGKSFAGPFFCSLDKETLSDQVLNFKHNNVVFLNSTQNETMVVPSAFQPTIHIYAQAPQGTNLSIRGDRGGLSWHKGQPLVEIEENHWIYRSLKDFESLEYKILIDDKIWEPGEKNRTLKTKNNAIEAVDFKLPSAPPLGKCTRLSIRCDASKGSAFKIHGTGPGMGWQNGLDLRRVGDNLWVWETFSYFNNFEYKIVNNNRQWESGPNHRAQFGKMEEVFTRF